LTFDDFRSLIFFIDIRPPQWIDANQARQSVTSIGNEIHSGTCTKRFVYERSWAREATMFQCTHCTRECIEWNQPQFSRKNDQSRCTLDRAIALNVVFQSSM
jgi:hypothetical protein